MWNEEQRSILRITVSGKEHKLDPLPVIRRYRGETRKAGPEVFSEAIKKVLEGEETEELAKFVLPVIYRVLQWKPFSEDPEDGYTEREAIEGFVQFIEWLLDSKKKDESLLSSSVSDAPSTSEIAATASSSSLDSAETLSNPEGLGFMS